MSLFAPRISLRAAEQLCTRFATALKAGIDPLKLLDTESRMVSRRHRKAIEAVRERVLAGDSLAEAMQSRSDYFPNLLTQMVTAGEHAGGLDKTFAYMSHYYRDLRETRINFLRQIMWPAIQCTLVIIIISLLIYVMELLFRDPQNKNYDPLGFGLRGTSGVLTFWAYIGGAALVLGIIVRAVWKNWLGLHKILMPIVIRVPVIGGVFKNLALSRLTTVLSLMLNAGVDAVRSVQMAFVSTGNDYYISRSGIVVDQVKANQTLASSFAAARVLPREFIEAVDVGELSGSEIESLDALAREYDQRAKTSLTAISMIASVSVWLLIAGVIIFIVFRLFSSYLGIINDASKGI